MADVNVSTNAPKVATTPASNGGTVAPAKPKKEVHQLSTSPTDAERAEIKAAADALLAKVGAAGMPGVEFSMGKFVLAHALKSIRADKAAGK